MQDRVALPEPVTLVGETVHDVLLLVKLTTPANPLIPVTVSVEVPAALALTVTETCLLPVVVNVHDRVELPDPVTLVGETLHDVLLVARPTTPAKPLTADIVMLDVPAAFTLTVTLVGLAAIVKS